MLFSCVLSLILFSPIVWSHPGKPHILPRQSNLNPYPDKRLVFKPDGTFKLAVFSDLHFGENPWEAWGPQHDAATVQLLQDILGMENPDFAVLNGDLITGENALSPDNLPPLIDRIFGPLKARNLPFATTHGNHDNSATITHLAEIQQIQQKFPFSYTRTGPSGVGGFGGEGNYWVPVYAQANDPKPALVIWFFDSRGGKPPSSNPGVAMADWVDASVADWIDSETNAMEQAWGPSDQRGALAFVHIPPNAIQVVQSNVNAQKNPGMNDDGLGGGTVQNTNDGPFWNALTSKIQNLHAIISGHDHGNEWCAREPTKKVLFCFDKHSGYGGYTKDGWGYGARTILFNSPDPRAGVDTWIKLQSGEVKAKITLDNQYDPIP